MNKINKELDKLEKYCISNCNSTNEGNCKNCHIHKKIELIKVANNENN